MLRLVCIVGFAVALAYGQPRTSVVNTKDGPVQGVFVNDVNEFHSIPFAAPPVKDLRFKPPAPVTPWTSVIDASKPAPQCIQNSIVGVALNISVVSGQEDCLYLDVYSPKGASGKAVMVWIHGGGLLDGDSFGGGEYNGSSLAHDHDLVVVSLSYRLGPFGYLALKELTQESPHNSSGHYGLLDQIAGLQWVQDNIAAFGGDPTKVTIFGESAGAISVCGLLGSPLTKGLFRGAIMESGSCDNPGFFQTAVVAQGWGKEVSSKAGCPQGPNLLECLRSVPAGNLLGNQTLKRNDKDFVPNLWPVMPYGISLNPYSLPMTPLQMMKAGKSTQVPLLIGSNLDEGSVFMFLLPVIVPGASIFPSMQNSLDAFKAIIGTSPQGSTTHFNPSAVPAADKLAQLAVEEYGLGDDGLKNLDILAGGLRDYIFLCSARRTAWALNNIGVDAYMYQFTYPIHSLPWDILGDYHSSEIPFVFNTQEGKGTKMSAIMTEYWTTFAKTGVPAGTDLPTWNKCDQSTDQYMNLTVPATPMQHVNKRLCDFWDANYAVAYHPGSP